MANKMLQGTCGQRGFPMFNFAAKVTGKSKFSVANPRRPLSSNVSLQKMKTILLIALLFFAKVATANEYPQYYEKAELNHYYLIIVRDNTSAIYLERLTHDNGEIYFYYDDQATWGEFPKRNGKKTIPSIWLQVKDYLFHYYYRNSNLIEYDKTGDNGVFVKVVNSNTNTD